MFRVSPGGAAAVPAVAVATSAASPYLPAGATTRLTTTVTNSSPRTRARRHRAPGGARRLERRAARRRRQPACARRLGDDRLGRASRPAAAAGRWVTLRPAVSFRAGARRGTGRAQATVDVPPAAADAAPST